MKATWITNIQALRGFAVLLVVVRHLQVYTTRTIGTQPMLGHFLVGDMGVDLFFVISGFIMVTVHQAPVARPADAGKFLYRRASRIYPLYWLYSLPALAIYFWRPGWLHRSAFGMVVHPLRSFLLWPQRNWPLLGQAWSLVYEMYFYLVFAGLLLLPEKWFRIGLLAWAGAVLAGNSLLARVPAFDRPETRLVCAMLTLEFIAGALVGLALRQTKPYRWQTAGGWLAVGFGIVWIVEGLLPLEVHLTGTSRLLGYGLPCVALVYGLTTLEGTGQRCPQFLQTVGDWSYSIYLSHIFVIAALARLISLQPTLGWASEILLEVGGLVAVLLTGALSYRYLEMPLLRLCRWPLPAWPTRPLPEPEADPFLP